MLQAENIHHYYGGSHSLRGVHLSAMQGRCTALLGRNGVGKTTLLKCLMGVLPVAGGRIVYEGTDITRMPPHQRARLGIAYVPQGREIFSQLTVEENLRIGQAASSTASGGIPGDIYALFPVLQTMRARMGGNLSGGQQQQLAIARALVSRPKLVIFDEPTEGIQPSVITEIKHVIASLKASSGISIILCEQYFDFACELADDFIVLSRGEVVASGTRATMDRSDVRAHLSV